MPNQTTRKTKTILRNQRHPDLPLCLNGAVKLTGSAGQTVRPAGLAQKLPGPANQVAQKTG